MKRRLIAILIGGSLAVFSTIFFLIDKKKNSSDVITLFGNVDVRQVDISFRIPGRIETMFFEEGQYVPKGTLMTQIEKQPYLDEVDKAKALIESVRASLENAVEIAKRREALVEEGAVSAEDYQNALTQKEVLTGQLKEAEASLRVNAKNLEDCEVASPSNGIILTRVKEIGSVVKQADPVYTLSLTDPMWVRAFVPETLLGQIYPDMPADVYTDSSNLPVYKGHIGFISPVAEFTPKTVETLDLRTDLVYRLRIIVDNPDWGLKQGMPVTIKLHPRGQRSHGNKGDLDPKSL
jgi:HlyD family secretion protein